MIELRDLQYFVVVADELHFGRAAERLFMAQSPLSQRILQLERQLGVRLIDRGHHVVGLTDAGKVFLPAATALLDQAEAATQLARRAGRGEVGTIVIGYVSEVTADLLPLSLKAFKDQRPNVEIELREGTTGQLREALRQRKVDVAFTRSPSVRSGDLAYQQLIWENLMLARPEGRGPLVGACCLRDLAAERYVLPTSGAAQGLRTDIEVACEGAGFRPNVVRESSPFTAVLLLVAAGVGIALVPASVARLYPIPGVVYAELSSPVPTTTAGVAWRRDEPSDLVSCFLELARFAAEQRPSHPR